MSKDRDLFIATLATEARVKNYPATHIVDLAGKIMRQAATIGRHAENLCNREVTPAEINRAERCRARLVELLKPYKIGVNCSGDPRGYCVKLILPSGRYNTWGGADEGYGVPGS